MVAKKTTMKWVVKESSSDVAPAARHLKKSKSESSARDPRALKKCPCEAKPQAPSWADMVKGAGMKEKKVEKVEPDVRDNSLGQKQGKVLLHMLHGLPEQKIEPSAQNSDSKPSSNSMGSDILQILNRPKDMPDEYKVDKKKSSKPSIAEPDPVCPQERQARHQGSVKKDHHQEDRQPDWKHGSSAKKSQALLRMVSAPSGLSSSKVQSDNQGEAAHSQLQKQTYQAFQLKEHEQHHQQCHEQFRKFSEDVPRTHPEDNQPAPSTKDLHMNNFLCALGTTGLPSPAAAESVRMPPTSMFSTLPSPMLAPPLPMPMMPPLMGVPPLPVGAPLPVGPLPLGPLMSSVPFMQPPHCFGLGGMPAVPPGVLSASPLPPPPVFTPRPPSLDQNFQMPVAPCQSARLPGSLPALGLEQISHLPIASSSSVLSEGMMSTMVAGSSRRSSMPASFASRQAAQASSSTTSDRSEGPEEAEVQHDTKASSVQGSADIDRHVKSDSSAVSTSKCENTKTVENESVSQLEAECEVEKGMSRASSMSSLHSPQESNSGEPTADRLIPQAGVSWEFPLSKSEKRLLYTQLCDKERAAAVTQYNQLKRRVSMGRPPVDTPSDSSDGSQSEECEDEQGQKLLEKERELQRQLQEVRQERRRLSVSRP